jgi:glutamine synthetase
MSRPAPTGAPITATGADANPYLVAAAILAGMHHGIKEQLDPSPMTEEKANVEYQVTLPVRWSKALDAFEAGAILPRYFGEEYHRVYGVVKREESELFHSEITDRDYEWYLRAV